MHLAIRNMVKNHLKGYNVCIVLSIDIVFRTYRLVQLCFSNLTFIKGSIVLDKFGVDPVECNVLLLLYIVVWKAGCISSRWCAIL